MGKQISKEPQTLSDIKTETSFTDGEIKDWYRAFLEEYPDGTVSVEQFKTIYVDFFPCGNAEQFAGHVFRTFDKNNDQRIDFREFIIGLNVMSKGTVEQKLKWAFQIYDIDSNGFISREEMLEIMRTMHKMVPVDVEMSADVSTPSKRVDKIFRRMDTDGDDHLSLEEFIEGSCKDLSLVHLLEQSGGAS